MTSLYLNKLNNICYYLILLFPISLIFSNFISELILIILIIFFLKNNFTIFKLRSFIEFFGVIFFIFFLILVFSSLLSDFNLFSLKKSTSFLRFILFSFSICWILNSYKNALQNLFKIMIISFLFLQFGVLIEYLFDYNIMTGAKEMGQELSLESIKISSFFGDEDILGSYISRLYPIILALFAINLPNLKKNFIILSYIVIFLAPVAVFFSGERLSFFFMIIFFLGLLLIIKIKKKHLILILGLILVISSFDLQRERIFNYTLKQITGEKKIIFYSKDHHAHFTTAYNIFLDNKFFGAGPNTFRKNCSNKKYQTSERSCSTHPHNYFIQLLSETGIIGTLIPVSIFLLLVFKFLNMNIFKSRSEFKKRNQDIKSYFLIFFIFCLFPLTPNGNFFNNWLNMIFFFGFGIYLHFFNTSIKLSNTELKLKIIAFTKKL